MGGDHRISTILAAGITKNGGGGKFCPIFSPPPSVVNEASLIGSEHYNPCVEQTYQTVVALSYLSVFIDARLGIHFSRDRVIVIQYVL